ncbi:MAG TPA: type II secretion system F family protein [Candidatus Omnitrophota bacterium]|nr:type II secretion system F family protein [Candidatus Omnitrophota bacterium]HPS20621.1 type II secretion system F family protein [Candidatus Omnitrophota bacterium]
MPIYSYRARDKEGKLLVSRVEAGTQLELASRLRSLGYSIISIEEERAKGDSVADLMDKLMKRYKNELVFFCRQLASLLKAGISLTESLSSIIEQTKSGVLKKAEKEVLRDIENGLTFSQALAKHPDIFSDLFISMVKVGESSGALDEVLFKLSEIYMQDMEVRARIQSAVTYPVILVFVAVVIVTFLLINIVPKFVVVFETYDAALPIATRILLGASFVVRKLWMILLLGAAVAGWWFRGYVRTSKGLYVFHSFLLKLPLFGELYLKVIVSRFARSLGALLKAGVPVLEALSVTEKVIGNSVIVRVVENVRTAVIAGKPLSEPFRASGVFPPTIVQMMTVGEQSGKLDDMLVEVADFYDREVDYSIKNVTTALEPLLLLAMGGMVAFIALSVLMPIFNLIKVFRHG